MSLTASTNKITAGNGQRIKVPGLNANVFYAGGYCQIDRSTGLAQEAADTANFVGFGVCCRQVTANGATGDNEVELLTGPFILKEVLVVGSDNVNDTGDPVYATADDTLTLSSTGNTKPIGVLVRYYGSTTKSDVAVFPFWMDQAF